MSMLRLCRQMHAAYRHATPPPACVPPLQAQKQALQAQLDVVADAQQRTRESLKHLKTGTRFTRGGGWEREWLR